MATKISKLESGLLSVNHVLYKILKSSNAPVWWKKVKRDKELYIEIRKKNIIDVYYRGGRMAELKWNLGKIEVKAHPKYLNLTDVDDARYYTKKIDENGKLKIMPKYQNCEEWLTFNIKGMKANIRTHYSGDMNGEATSEKFIQGNLIINGRDRYLDSEFAHRLYDGGRKSVRIDLVKIEGEHFVFEELKRIKDGRLLKKETLPEILTQIDNYRDFLKENKDELTVYYRTLYKIKKKLGLPVPLVDDIDKVTVDVEPQLSIALNYDKSTKARDERVKKIKDLLLKERNVIPIIYENF